MAPQSDAGGGLQPAFSRTRLGGNRCPSNMFRAVWLWCLASLHGVLSGTSAAAAAPPLLPPPPAHIQIMTAYGYDAPVQAGWTTFGKSFNLSALVEGHRTHSLPGMWRIDCIGCQADARRTPSFASGVICDARQDGTRFKRWCSKADGDATNWDEQTRRLLTMARPHLLSGVLVGIFLGDEITGHGRGGRAVSLHTTAGY
jgi:hypothetical protein